jgi:predicted PurR-regulated permease PerM
MEAALFSGTRSMEEGGTEHHSRGKAAPGAGRTPISDRAFYARTFALVTLLLLGYLLFRILEPFFAPLAWALFIAFLLHPVHARLVPRLGGRASLSAALLTVATLLMLLGPIAAFGAAFAGQVAELLQYAQEFAAEHRRSPPDLADVPVLGPLIDWLQDNVGISVVQMQAWAIEGARTVLRWLAALGRQAVLGALGTVLGFIFMMFILFFAIRDGREMFFELRALIPMTATERARLLGHLASVTRAMVFGTGVTALIQGALIAIGFSIVGLPSPIVFGVIAAFFAVVPLAGTPLVWVPAAVMLALQDRWYAALFLFLWGSFVATIDNVLRPILVAGRAEVGTLTVFIGVLGGVYAFGAVGVIVGPLVLALAIALVRYTLEVRQVSDVVDFRD